MLQNQSRDGETLKAPKHQTLIWVFAPSSPFFENVSCVRETQIIAEQQPPREIFFCDHAGPVINKFSSVFMYIYTYEYVNMYTYVHVYMYIYIYQGLKPKP